MGGAARFEAEVKTRRERWTAGVGFKFHGNSGDDGRRGWSHSNWKWKSYTMVVVAGRESRCDAAEKRKGRLPAVNAGFR